MSKAVVGILYPGEMGAAVAAALVGRGVDVVTTTQGRSGASSQRAGECGARVLATLADVVQAADIALSLVPPANALEVAQSVAAIGKPILYVDVNSISPQQSVAISESVAGLEYLDAAINGLAKNFRNGGTLFLSGQRANEVAALFDGVTRVRVLEAEIGQAKSMKMLLAGLSKGICALFAELGIVAESQQMLPALMDETRAIYPGIAALIERMMPTYAQHAARRATEMGELEQMCESADLAPVLIHSIRLLHESIAATAFEAIDGTSAQNLIHCLAQAKVLDQATQKTLKI